MTDDSNETDGVVEREELRESSHPSPGGGGEHLRGEMLQLQRAVAAGWNIPAGVRARIVERLTALVESPAVNARQLLSITRVIAQLARDDVEAEKPAAAPAVAVLVGQPHEMSESDRLVLLEAAKVLRRQEKLSDDSQSHAR